MARVHFHMPPELAECGGLGAAGQICLICLMVARGAQLDYLRTAWEPAAADGTDHQKWFMYDTGDTVDIREAVVVGVSDMMPGLLMPVCWDHLAGITVRPAPQARRPLFEAGGPLPPGLTNGKHR